jgi:hypothetical protein
MIQILLCFKILMLSFFLFLRTVVVSTMICFEIIRIHSEDFNFDRWIIHPLS